MVAICLSLFFNCARKVFLVGIRGWTCIANTDVGGGYLLAGTVKASVCTLGHIFVGNEREQ